MREEVRVAVPVEAFMADVYLAGTFEGTAAALREQLDLGASVQLLDVTMLPVVDLAAGAAERVPVGSIAAGEIFLAALPTDPDAPQIHRVYYPVELELGPYAVIGDMALLPGFDPGRALTRPTSDFIELGGAQVRIATSSGAIEQGYDQLAVNRFAVEHVTCEIDMTFWFPGAAQELPPEE